MICWRARSGTNVSSKGHVILSTSTNSDMLSASLRDLTDVWQELNDVARDRYTLLQNALQVYRTVDYLFDFSLLTIQASS